MEQQTEIFVPKSLAMELKAKGYNEECVAYYSEGVRSYPISKHGYSTNSEFKMNGFCTAPTYDQVVGWFASEHELDIDTSFTPHAELYYAFVSKKTGISIFKSSLNANRQQSLLTAFEEALKLI